MYVRIYVYMLKYTYIYIYICIISYLLGYPERFWSIPRPSFHPTVPGIGISFCQGRGHLLAEHAGGLLSEQAPQLPRWTPNEGETHRTTHCVCFDGWKMRFAIYVSTCSNDDKIIICTNMDFPIVWCWKYTLNAFTGVPSNFPLEHAYAQPTNSCHGSSPSRPHPPAQPRTWDLPRAPVAEHFLSSSSTQHSNNNPNSNRKTQWLAFTKVWLKWLTHVDTSLI